HHRLRVAEMLGQPLSVDIQASSPILTIVPLIIRRLRGPSPNRVIVRSPTALRVRRLVNSPTPVPVGAPPRESLRARVRLPPQPWAPACVVPPSVGSDDTVAAAPCQQSQSRGPV